MTAAAFEHTDERLRWDRFIVACALGYCLMVGALSSGMVLAELREQFGISGVIAALHGSTFGISLLVAGVFGAAWTRRWSRHTVIRTAVASMAVGIAVFALGPAWPVTLLGTAFSGFGAATLVMVMPGLVNDQFGHRRAEAFALVNAAPGIAGVTLSLVVGALLGAGQSWRPAFLAYGALVTGGLWLIARPVELPEVPDHGTFSLQIFRRREVFVPYLFIVNAVLAEFTTAIWAPTYLREVGGASAGLAPILASSFGVMMFASRMVMSPIINRFGEYTLTASFIGVSVGASAMCIVPNLAVRTLALAFVGFCGGALYPLTVDRLYRRAEPSVGSVALGGVCALASGVAVTVGPLAAGVLADSVGLRWAILVAPALAVVGAVTQHPAVSTRLLAPRASDADALR